MLAEYDLGNLAVRLGDGAGGLAVPLNGTPPVVGRHPYSVAIGDFDRDGAQDVAVGNINGGSSAGDQTVSLLRGDGTGLFGTQITVKPASNPVDLKGSATWIGMASWTSSSAKVLGVLRLVRSLPVGHLHGEPAERRPAFSRRRPRWGTRRWLRARTDGVVRADPRGYAGMRRRGSAVSSGRPTRARDCGGTRPGPLLPGALRAGPVRARRRGDPEAG